MPRVSERNEPVQQITYWGALRRFRRRVLWILGFYNIILACGTLGYHLIEGWSWFESLYMAVITASSIGYGEVHPLSHDGRLFTMALIGFSVVGLGLVWAILTAFLVELDLGDVYRRRRMHKRIDSLHGHYIVCGLGRMGRVVAGEMLSDGIPLVVAEKSMERIESLLERHPNLLWVEGDATQDRSLLAARVREAKGLACALPTDADNLFVCLTARALNPSLNIASRANDGEAVPKMHVAGANHTILPNVTGGVRLAATLIRPSVVSFLDASTVTGDTTLRLEELKLPESSSLVGRSLADARIPQETGLIVLALRRHNDEGPAVFNPGGDTRLESGDVMIVLGQPEQVSRLRKYAAH